MYMTCIYTSLLNNSLERFLGRSGSDAGTPDVGRCPRPGPGPGHLRVRVGSQEVLLWVGSLFRSGCHGPGTGGLHGAVRGGPHKACLSGFPQVPLALVALPNTRFPQHPLGSPPNSYYWLSVVFVLRVALSKTFSALPPSCLRGHHGELHGLPGSHGPLAGRGWWGRSPSVRPHPAFGAAEGCGCSVIVPLQYTLPAVTTGGPLEQYSGSVCSYSRLSEAVQVFVPSASLLHCSDCYSTGLVEGKHPGGSGLQLGASCDQDHGPLAYQLVSLPYSRVLVSSSIHCADHVVQFVSASLSSLPSLGIFVSCTRVCCLAQLIAQPVSNMTGGSRIRFGFPSR